MMSRNSSVRESDGFCVPPGAVIQLGAVIATSVSGGKIIIYLTHLKRQNNKFEATCLMTLKTFS